MPQIKANGLSFEYDERGAGDPLLLIMGLGAQMTRWPDAFCDKLAAKGFRVIRFDNRDVGLSEKIDAAGLPDIMALFQAIMSGQPAEAAYDLSDMAADAVGVLDALGVAKAHVVGASMGGMIGQLVAADYPQRVASFCSIMSSTGARDLPPAKPEAIAVLNNRGPDPAVDREGALDYSETVASVIGSPGYPADPAQVRARAAADLDRCYHPAGFQRQYAAALTSPERRAKCATITAPTVVIHGADDPLAPVEGGRDTAQHIRDSIYLEIPGMGHDLPPALYDTIVEAIAANAARARETAS